MSKISARAFLCILVFVLLNYANHEVSHAATITGELKQWHTVTLTFAGPTTGESEEPNPFTDFRLTVVFTHPASQTQYTIPGFFAADGRAATTSASEGNQWRVRFSPPKVGKWTYRAVLLAGESAAISQRSARGARVVF